MSHVPNILRNVQPLLLAIVLLSGCAAAPMNTVPALGNNDFPTLARVEMVFQCMDKRGKQNYDTLYACVCVADKMAEKIRYQTFVEAQAFAHLVGLAGERGSAFRDHPDSRPLRKQLQDAQRDAESACSFSSAHAQDAPRDGKK